MCSDYHFFSPTDLVQSNLGTRTIFQYMQLLLDAEWRLILTYCHRGGSIFRKSSVASVLYNRMGWVAGISNGISRINQLNLRMTFLNTCWVLKKYFVKDLHFKNKSAYDLIIQMLGLKKYSNKSCIWEHYHLLIMILNMYHSRTSPEAWPNNHLSFFRYFSNSVPDSSCRVVHWFYGTVQWRTVSYTSVYNRVSYIFKLRLKYIYNIGIILYQNDCSTSSKQMANRLTIRGGIEYIIGNAMNVWDNRGIHYSSLLVTVLCERPAVGKRTLTLFIKMIMQHQNGWPIV